MKKYSEQIKKGHTFGDWLVVEFGTYKSLCKCSCGRCEKLVRNANLLNGGSARCLQCGRERCHEAHIGKVFRRVLKHLPSEVYQRLMTVTNNAIKRCTDSSSAQWKDYGGRGITVLPLWIENRWKFAEYLSTLPGFDDPDLVIDRENNDLGYIPGNLRFVTRSVSCLNRRKFETAHDCRGRFASKHSETN